MQKALVAATFAVAAFVGGGASAADVYSAGGMKDGPSYVTVTNWSGFYAGANVGYGSSVNTYDTDLIPEGIFGGGQLGFNMQRGSLVFGLETDIQDSDVSQSDSSGYSSKLNWFGTVRGRAGYAYDQALIYATAGFAYGEVSNTFPCCGKSTETQTGWVVGGGVEFKLTPVWSVKGEYQYIDLDAPWTGAGPLGEADGQRSQINTFRVGVNYFFAPGYEPLK